MNIKEAKEALERAFEDIAAMPREAGFSVKYECGYSNSEYERLEDGDGAECIFGEMTLGVEGAEETVVFECAAGAFEGDGEAIVADEELAQNIGTVRENIRSFLADVNEAKATVETESIKDAFLAVIEREEKENAEKTAAEAPKSNAGFYIAAACGALAIVAFFLCFKWFFG